MLYLPRNKEWLMRKILLDFYDEQVEAKRSYDDRVQVINKQYMERWARALQDDTEYRLAILNKSEGK